MLVIVISGIAASFTDWFFMGVLFHEKYNDAPEVWRNAVKNNERRLIIWSQAIGVITSVAFAYLCVATDSLSVWSVVRTATLVWLAGPVVVLAQMVLWIKLHPLVGVSNSLGWLARFLLTGLLAVWLL